MTTPSRPTPRSTTSSSTRSGPAAPRWRRAPLTPGDEREAAAESEKKHAADLSARVAGDDSDDEDGDSPPRPPTRKYKY